MKNEISSTQRSLAKGLIAGAIGGLVATAAKTFFERIYPPRTHGEPEPPLVLAQRIAGHTLSGTERTAAVESIQWGFGAVTGAAYGALVEYYPAATAKDGASFGLALETLTQERLLPALELSAPPEEQTVREQSSEIASHMVYGMVTETVRRFVRRILELRSQARSS
jgi:putative membrane protein